MNLKGNLTSKGLQGSIGKSRMQGILGTNPAAIPITVDNALSLSSTNPVQNRVITAAITNRLWSDEVKAALLQIVEKVAYVDEHGQDYYDALYDALYPPVGLDSIGAVFDSSATIYNTMTLDDLKQYLVVTAYYTSGDSEVVTTYTLSGSMDAGTQTITVAYGGKTTTFTVTVVEWLVSIDAVFTPEQDTQITIDPTRIKAYISQTGAWIASDDSYSVCVPVISGKRYALAWSTTDSSSVGTIFRYGFSDTNTASGQTLSGWIRSTPQDFQNTQVTASGAYLVIQFGVSAASSIMSNNYFTLTQLATPIYDIDSLDTLRQYLVVTATYSDSTTAIVSDYTLSGTLAEGTSTITVTYGNKTDTFEVTVTSAILYQVKNYTVDRTSNPYILTDVALLSEDIDFTIAFDGTQTSAMPSNTAYRLFVCNDATTNYKGIYCGAGTSNTNVLAQWYNAGTNDADPTNIGIARSAVNQRTRIVYVHHKGSGSATITMKTGTGTAYKKTLTSQFIAQEAKVMIGGVGGYTYNWIGTIAECTIYQLAWSDAEVSAFLS